MQTTDKRMMIVSNLNHLQENVSRWHTKGKIQGLRRTARENVIGVFLKCYLVESGPERGRNAPVVEKCCKPMKNMGRVDDTRSACRIVKSHGREIKRETKRPILP